MLRSARRLQLALAGRPLTKSDFRWPSLATTDLRGDTVESVEARGKHLLIRTDGGTTIHSHLRMDGSWHVHRTGERWRNSRPEHGIRLILANAEWTAIGHRLGMLDVLGTDREDEVVGHLGMDILKDEWDLDEATARVLAQPGRTIGETLLDQRVIAGIGTFFMSEACFLRGVHPWRSVAEVEQTRGGVKALLELEHRLMGLSTERVVQVTTGNARKGEEQWVHSRVGRPCRRCSTGCSTTRR